MQLYEPFVLVQLAWLSFSSVSFLAGAAMGAINVGTIRIYVTIMASTAAFVDI